MHREQPVDRLPGEWREPDADGERVKPSVRKHFQVPTTAGLGGRDEAGGLACHVAEAAFRFCLCGCVSYEGPRWRDFGKLLTLGAGGRSTAMTTLSLAAVRSLRGDESLPEKARKLLSFSDNRQGASLQAGHFNQFVDVGLLRSALCRAARDVPVPGLRPPRFGRSAEAVHWRLFNLGLIDPPPTS